MTKFKMPANRDDIRSIKDAATPESNTYKIDLEIIHPDDKFNIRTDYGDIQELANSILEFGQIVPVIGDFMKDDKGVMSFILTDGFRRYKAFQLLKAQGKEVGKVLCRLNEKGISIEDRYFKMFLTQDNKKLTDIEVSNVFRHLLNAGVPVKTIAQKTGKSITHVNDMLVLSQQTESVKKAVEEGKASATAVIKLAKKAGADTVKKEVDNSISENKKFSVKAAEKLVEPHTPPTLGFNIPLVMPKTLSEMENLKGQLMALKDRSHKQVKFLNELNDAIRIRKDAESKSSFSIADKSIFHKNEFDTILYTEFCATYCEKIGMDLSKEIYNWFKQRV